MGNQDWEQAALGALQDGIVMPAVTEDHLVTSVLKCDQQHVEIEPVDTRFGLLKCLFGLQKCARRSDNRRALVVAARCHVK